MDSRALAFRNPGLIGIKAIGILNFKKLLISPDSQIEIADRGVWKPQKGSEQHDMKKVLCWEAYSPYELEGAEVREERMRRLSQLSRFTLVRTGARSTAQQ